MHIEIQGELEARFKAAMSEGNFATPEALLAKMLVEKEAAMSLPVPAGMPDKLDPDALALKQGIGPLTDFRAMKFEQWPEGESVDDFIAAIREARGSAEVRGF